MAMTQAQTNAELQRKRNLGIKPTNSANLGVYNKLTPLPKQKTGGIIPQGQESVRGYLNSHNVDNGAIGFGNGRVTVGGSGFITPTTNVNGKAYAPLEDLDKAYRRYQINQGLQKKNELLGDYEKAIDAPVTPYTAATPFTYNKDTDLAYQAALQSAMQNAKTASNNALVSLGARGIGNSSSAVSAANQIEQNALGQVTRDVLPALIEQAYNRYRDTENDRYAQYLDKYSQGQDKIKNIGDLLGTTSDLTQRDIDNGQTQYLNRQAEKAANINAANVVSGMTGKVIRPQEDVSGLYRQASDPNTPFTQSGKINNNTMQSAQLQDAWTTAQNVGYVTPELSKLTGIPVGTNTLDAIKTQNEQDRIDLGYIQQDAKMQGGNKPPEYNGLSAGQVMSALRTQLYDTDGYLKEGITPDKIYTSVVDFGLPDGQDEQVMLSLGLTKQQIAELDKKYGVTGK